MCLTMADMEVINLSSDSSRPSSPFINVSEVFNDTNKETTTFHPEFDYQDNSLSLKKQSSSNCSPEKNRIVHNISDSDHSESETLEKTENLNTVTSHQLESLCSSSSNLSVRSVLETNNVSPTQALLHKNYGEKSSKPKKNDSSPKKRKVETKNKTKLTKEERIEEKLKQQRDREHKRAEKIAVQEIKNQMKPGNCMKVEDNRFSQADSAMKQASVDAVNIALRNFVASLVENQ